MPWPLAFVICLIVLVSLVIAVVEGVTTSKHGYRSDIFWNAFYGFLTSAAVLTLVVIIGGALSFAVLTLFHII